MKASLQDPDRVRRHTAGSVNARLDGRTMRNIRRYSGQPPRILDRRIDELEREWDIERVLELNASALALGGLALAAATRRRHWLLLSGGVLGFLFLHAVQGWCPPVPALRRLGVRTRNEIDREQFALRLARGDFGAEAARTRTRPSELAEDAVARD